MLGEHAMLQSIAAGAAAALAESVVHPLDTLVCRTQSGLHYRWKSPLTKVLDRAFLRGLYQGFGPTLVASIPASVGFFTIYESAKAHLSSARSSGRLKNVPPFLDYALSSAAAEAAACAILNPAQVMKQIAQATPTSRTMLQFQPPHSSTAQVLRIFAKRPSKMWAGYTILMAAQIPHVCLMFTIYETLKKRWFAGYTMQPGARAATREFQASAICGAVASACSSWLFVPADIIRLRIRLAIGPGGAKLGNEVAIACVGKDANPGVPCSKRTNVLVVIRDIVHREGWKTLFRGSLLNCVAAAVSGGIYLGSFEAMKALYAQK